MNITQARLSVYVVVAQRRLFILPVLVIQLFSDDEYAYSLQLTYLFLINIAENCTSRPGRFEV